MRTAFRNLLPWQLSIPNGQPFRDWRFNLCISRSSPTWTLVVQNREQKLTSVGEQFRLTFWRSSINWDENRHPIWIPGGQYIKLTPDSGLTALIPRHLVFCTYDVYPSVPHGSLPTTHQILSSVENISQTVILLQEGSCFILLHSPMNWHVGKWATKTLFMVARANVPLTHGNPGHQTSTRTTIIFMWLDKNILVNCLWSYQVLFNLKSCFLRFQVFLLFSGP